MRRRVARKRKSRLVYYIKRDYFFFFIIYRTILVFSRKSSLIRLIENFFFVENFGTLNALHGKRETKNFPSIDYDISSYKIIIFGYPLRGGNHFDTASDLYGRK